VNVRRFGGLLRACHATAPTPRSENNSLSTSDRQWCLYLIECRNGSMYAGITNNLDARYAAHVAGRGARYTRSNPPVRLVGFRPCEDRAAASRAEWEIKRLPRERKIEYLQSGSAG
jgi:putative endonuclease